MTRILSALRRDEGASTVEYGLLIVAIAALIAVVVFALGAVSPVQLRLLGLGHRWAHQPVLIRGVAATTTGTRTSTR